MAKQCVTEQIVPGELKQRLEIRDAVRAYIAEQNLHPPLLLDLLEEHACQCLSNLQLDDTLRNYTMIQLNNALWEDYFSHIPIDQRLLLLPVCLRDHKECQAPSDALGLICQQCGICNIPDITDQAEALGMSVLVAESSSSVSQWVKDGEIQGIIGVSCLDSLEKAFPSMLRHAVPGIAIPLNTDGCKDTDYDQQTLNEAIHIGQASPIYANPSPMIKQHITELFTPARIQPYLNATTPHLNQFNELILSALCDDGKHYRPMITLDMYCSITNQQQFPDYLEPIAIAVECFHKASLIHDDIEDGDDQRYDKPTMHQRVGLPIALNLGDFLIGEGYRLLSHPSIPQDIRSELYAQAAQAHCELALGQAQEFECLGKATTLDQCLQTHQLKTAPAFRVAMYLGAIATGKFNEYEQTLHALSDALGIAYQLYDDLEDTMPNTASAVDTIMQIDGLNREDAINRISDLYATYQHKAYAALEEIKEAVLKTFMYRLCGRILKDV
ncbi:MAG: polyprenyl synthetase family protein [Phycisphaeraceae bacterium JB051]